ncbi:hypothetical protein FA396_17125, partial [Pseudomonas aeruginosa]|nr:hypothetical protein [Pseudomonas aeruginosa]
AYEITTRLVGSEMCIRDRLMIGGNIPEKTRVVSVQIFDHVEAMEYAQAHWLAGGMVAFSFIVLLALYSGRRRRPGWA